MDVKAQFTNPAEMEMAVTVTMTLAEWIKWREQIKEANLNAWPATRMSSEIGDAIYHVQKTFYPERAKEDGDGSTS